MRLPTVIEKPLCTVLRTFYLVCLLFCKLWWKTPWYKAFVTTALKKYVESSWYRDRLEIGLYKRQVVDMFLDRDIRYFKWKTTRRERWGIFFTPYSYTQRAKLVVREAGLIDYF